MALTDGSLQVLGLLIDVAATAEFGLQIAHFVAQRLAAFALSTGFRAPFLRFDSSQLQLVSSYCGQRLFIPRHSISCIQFRNDLISFDVSFFEGGGGAGG